jgi:hypothetical protein
VISGLLGNAKFKMQNAKGGMGLGEGWEIEGEWAVYVWRLTTALWASGPGLSIACFSRVIGLVSNYACKTTELWTKTYKN